jgi:hypothetical protein
VVLSAVALADHAEPSDVSLTYVARSAELIKTYGGEVSVSAQSRTCSTSHHLV